MSNKIALATIQFRADAKGANVALDSLRASAKEARKTVDEMQDALNRGIKTMKDANGVDFDVEAKLKSATKEARNFESAIHELMKGATALESVVKNIRMGEIEKSSRAELKGAINAAESRKRSVRGDDEESLRMQRELNIVIEESRKQLNNLDRDTQKVIETLKNGGVVAEATLEKEQKGLKEILSLIPKGTDEYKQYAAQLKEIQTYVANIRQQEQAQATALLSDKNLGKYSEEQIRAAIQSARELIQTYKTASPEAKALADNIVRAEQHLKDYGIEAARAAAKETAQIKTQEEAEKQLRVTMNKRLTELPKLSAEALAETKKYWEAQRNGAEANSKELARYEANLKKVMNQEQKRRVTQLDNVLTQPSQHGIAEVRAALAEMEKLRDSVRQGTNAWLHYNKMVEQGKAYLDGLAKSEALNKITTQMNDLQHLSTSGLAEVKKYWETMVAGAAQGSAELTTYEAELKKVVTEEQRRAELQAQSKIGILSSGNLGQYSESQIRQAIEAGKQLIQTYKTANPAAQALAKNIVAAEEHLKQYGLEAERSARREAEALKKAQEQRRESVALMTRQLQQAYRGAQFTPSVLKSQEQFWQRLIDDPKTAASSLDLYRHRLQQVKDLQFRMMQDEGQKALDFFRGGTRNASVDQIKQYAEALKRFRDSLPRETAANIIKEIDGYLVQAGEDAKVAADKAMELNQAYKIGFQSLHGKFKGTNEQLRQAKKTLEEQLAVTEKGTKEYDQLRRAIDGIILEEKRLGGITKEVQATLDNPKGKSFNELKVAVEQGRAALAGMRTETEADKKKFDELSAKVKECDIQMKQLGNSSKGTASSFDKAWSRLKTYIGLYMGAAVAIQKLTATMGDLMDLSDKMGEVRKTTGFSADEVGRLSENLKKLDTRTSITGLLDLSVAAGQLGLKTEEDVQGFTEAANKLMVALPEMGKEGATEMLKVALATGEIDKIRKQMEQGLIEGSSATAVAMEKVGSTIDRLRATSAATAPAITDFVKRVGAVGAQSGISIDQVAALGSTVDALGMRVEMSATALSRMIPAIKNNAFDVAKAIGVTPDTLRNLFETGKGMEAILMIFQRIKDAGMDEDSVEKMLGMGNMKEIMKELNQQGARAGIVFAGLSQNVDTLREHLRTAANAYQENIAIQQEYDKMNETTAAKWERLKNQIEELFVGDQAQRFLGGIIDGLRKIVNLVESLHRSILVLSVVFATYRLGLGEALKSLWTYMTNIGDSVKDLKKWFSELNKANVWGAVIAGAMAAAYAIYDWIDSMKEAAREAAKFEAELIKEQMKVDNLATSIGKARAKMEDANEEVNKAQKAFDTAKKSLDGTRESTEKLTKAETELIEKQEMQRNAMAEHKRLIESFNTEYGKYLGFMLSEIASDMELAQARELVNDKLRETITLKRKEAALTRVENSLGEDRDTSYASLWDAVQGAANTKDKNGKQVSDPTKAARVINTITKAAQKGFKTLDDYKAYVQKTLKDNNMLYEDLMHKAVVYYKDVDKIRKANQKIESQWEGEESANRSQSQADLKRQYDSAVGNYAKLATIYTKSTGEARKKAAADLLKQMDSINEMVDNAGSYYRMEDATEKKDYDTFMNNADKRVKGMKDQREQLLKEAGDAYKPRGTVGGGKTASTNANPWGSPQPGESTNYKDMNAEVLVNRRKQMKDFVNAIQTDSDVQAVLAEDKALKKAIENGMSSDMRTVIEWYNTERLKIQDELHARHLTNTGDWLDPKQQKARKKRLQDDTKAYLEELDAYYTERKAKIQEARNDEEISEAEAWNRDIRNEAEWHRRRAELQKMYADKGVEVTKEEQDAILNIISERTEDDVKFIRATIDQTVKFSKAIRDANAQGAKEYRKFVGDLNLGWEKDFLKQRQALGRHLKAIEDIVDKERPFNGIAKNMQDNLGKMGILTADLGDDAESAADELKRLTFLMEEAESAYTMTVEKLLDDMRRKGFKEWADAIAGDTNMQQGMLAMLRMTFDSVQDAIKNESNIIKKQAEIMMQDITDQAQADDTRLQILQNSVSRANSLIGAGAASERVADKLAIKQIQLQITMQETRIRMLQKRGADAVALLKQEAELAKQQGQTEKAKQMMMDAENVDKSVGLTLTKEQVELDKQRVALSEKLEESQNRLYTQLREWGELLSSSVRDLFEASHAGEAEYFNERAKLNLTGKGGPGAGTYIVIENEGTEDARAHYEYLDERAALERQLEVERENAQSDAWKKIWEDINMKLSETITDQLNAMLQNQAIDANTDATMQNTAAIVGLTSELEGKKAETGTPDVAEIPQEDAQRWASNFLGAAGEGQSSGSGQQYVMNPQEDAQLWASNMMGSEMYEQLMSDSDKAAKKMKENNDKITKSTKSSFAAMTAAANMYGVAFQTMSNDNLSTAQKVEMMIVQAAGQALISMLTAQLAASQGQTAAESPSWISKTLSQLGPIAGPVAVGVFTALIGGLMGVAVSKISKSKSQISQVTGASASAGRLATGMLTYAEGNVNEFTDPSTLTPGRQYNVDAADGRTYRARYMGSNPRTHLTNGPEFHLSGERGREMIIDAGTTRQITMNDSEVWHAIQTLSGGGRLSATRRRGKGVRAFADGNMDEFEEMGMDGYDMAADQTGGFTMEQAAAFQSSLDRNNELLERALTEGIHARFDVYGKGGLIDSYDTGKKTVTRHGERY